MNAVVPIKTYTGDDVDFQGLTYLNSRGISDETAKLLGVMSGRKYFKKSDQELDCIGFPYKRDDRVTASKWRSLDSKEFTQDGSAQTLCLADRIEVGRDFVVTEGEIEAMSFWEIGVTAVLGSSGALWDGFVGEGGD